MHRRAGRLWGKDVATHISINIYIDLSFVYLSFQLSIDLSSHLSICLSVYPPRRAASARASSLWSPMGWGFGLYKIFLYIKACVHESIIFFANTPLVAPPPLHTRLRILLFPLDPTLLQYITYKIVNDNIAWRPSEDVATHISYQYQDRYVGTFFLYLSWAICLYFYLSV